MQYWREITNGTYFFNRKLVIANLIETNYFNNSIENKSKIIEFFQQYIKKGGSLRKKLSTQIYGNQHTFVETTTNEDPSIPIVYIQNMDKFKHTMPLHPVQSNYFCKNQMAKL